MIAWWNALDTLMRRVVVISLIVLALIVILLTVSWCSEGRRAREARAGETIAQGRTQSAVEAINETASLEKRADATDDEVSDAHDAIRQADPADRDRVSRLQLCRLQHRPDCDRLQ